jgi:hypothetical protein
MSSLSPLEHDTGLTLAHVGSPSALAAAGLLNGVSLDPAGTNGLLLRPVQWPPIAKLAAPAVASMWLSGDPHQQQPVMDEWYTFGGDPPLLLEVGLNDAPEWRALLVALQAYLGRAPNHPLVPVAWLAEFASSALVNLLVSLRQAVTSYADQHGSLADALLQAALESMMAARMMNFRRSGKQMMLLKVYSTLY